MKQTVTVKNGCLKIDGTDMEPLKLEDLIICFDGPERIAGAWRADYLFQQILDYNDMPSKFSIQRKLDKYKKIIK